MKRLRILTLLLVAVTTLAQAKVVLPSFFTDNMILQQRSEVMFHGQASAGKPLTITTSWNGETYRTQTGKDGSWKLAVPTPEAGGPYTITISDGKKLQLKNVLIGEVWFCSGQSNMEMPLAGWGKVMDYEKEVAEAAYPSIRLFQVKKNISLVPLNDVENNLGGWQECSPGTVSEFSSVAYFFARRLWKELNIPVGVIDCTWGGTPAEAWTSLGTVKQIEGFEKEIALLEQNNLDPNKLQQQYEQARADWQARLYAEDKGFANGTPAWAGQSTADGGWAQMNLPGLWERSALPGFDGIVWFRKEVQIPAEWAGKPVTLRLGMIDDEDITYFNGTEIAQGSGYNAPRTYTIPANLVKTGKAVVTVRVSDFGGEGGIYGLPEELYMECAGKRIALAGDWKYNVGLSLEGFPPAPVSPVGSAGFPTVLYNAMVHPLIQFPVQGVIWYQGEANVGRHAQYTNLFPAMIADWRKQWNREMPFYFVQLANFMERKTVQPESGWAALREAQAEALHLSETGMAVAIEIGVADDIHPKNKQEVGRRLAQIALAKTYQRKVAYSGPVYQSYAIEGKQIRICFQKPEGATSQKLTAGNSLEGFIIAGPDRVFHPAQARIEGETIVVSSPEVSMPQAVRYGWADNPDCTLYGDDGLPAAPFRTDNW